MASELDKAEVVLRMNVVEPTQRRTMHLCAVPLDVQLSQTSNSSPLSTYLPRVIRVAVNDFAGGAAETRRGVNSCVRAARCIRVTLLPDYCQGPGLPFG